MPAAGVGVSVETGVRAKVAESMGDRAAPVVGTGVLLNEFAGLGASRIGASLVDEGVFPFSLLADGLFCARVADF